jgi:hypothetical protein
MVSRRALAARIERLKELGAGLMKEIQLWEGMLWRGKEPPIPYEELHRYVAAIRKASTAVSEARIAIEKALRRPQQP